MGMTKAERLERDIRLMDEMKEHEEELRSSGLLLVAGMDEAGRGPLAGPVTAGPSCSLLNSPSPESTTQKN